MTQEKWSSTLLKTFIDYVGVLKGDEKGEAQVFLDRLFQAFGHAGYKEAGAELEHRVKKKDSTKFADLLWPPRLLLEMKKRGEKLQNHYRQAFDYWLNLTPHRPKYVILCNFDEFWIYDFNSQLDDPVDKILLKELSERYTALNFLFIEEKKPIFGNDRIAVTREAADKIARVFNSLVKRGEGREQAQRFVLQCVVALFAEDFELLPRGFFTEIIRDCRQGGSTYDLFGNLFRQMNSEKPAKGGRFHAVPYFNGGLFAIIEPIDLTTDELNLLDSAAAENWAKVQPPIFGTLFQSSMDQKERHAFGAHFTSEADIQKVVLPTIVRPWRERISRANTLKELLALRKEMFQFRVLDPACGSGNFLYVAYREMKRLEMELLSKIHNNFGEKSKLMAGSTSLVSAHQFFGIDINSFAVELAKVTLMLAKEQALEETRRLLETTQKELPFRYDEPLPLENLDENIICDDALFCEWPKSNVIIGNPPYQAKNKIQKELGPKYVSDVRARYDAVPGRSDYCVYWFRRAHDELPEGGRAGLVGTNSIRQNYSREGGLDYIVNSGGTIFEAVSTQVWSGEAAVHVSIVNWFKGKEKGKKKLFTQLGDDLESPWKVEELEHIHASLSSTIDVTRAVRLKANIGAESCYQGQTHGHESFLLTPVEAKEFIKKDSSNEEILFPYLIADDLIANLNSQPGRFVIDFFPRDLPTSARYKDLFSRVQKLVLPDRETAAKEETERNQESLKADPQARVNHHHRNFLNKWWQLSYPRNEMLEKISRIPRYIACGRVTKRPIFEFVSTKIRPNDAVMVFPMSDDYSFGILQSGIHWAWFTAKCSTLTERFRYTSDTVFDTFPWPQKPTLKAIKKVAANAVLLRTLRRELMIRTGQSFRELYRTLELPGKNPLKDAHLALDLAVREAYNMPARADVLSFLLSLNQELAALEEAQKPVIKPGLPPFISDFKPFETTDFVTIEDN